MPVAVVTDSTAYPLGTVEGRLTVVPLTVIMGDRQGLEGSEITSAEVARALAAGMTGVTTSRPSPACFTQVYDELLTSGFSEVVSVHLSARLSGTTEAAMIAAAEFGARVRVIDSGSVAMGLGFPAMAALEAAEAGADLTGVVRAVDTAIARTTTLFCARTLEYLRRGGRIGAASALVGTALAVKPILRIAPGEAVTVCDRVRTTGRALARLVDLSIHAAGQAPVDVAVHHLADPDRAASVADALTGRLGDQVRQCQISEVGAVVGVHTGPGLVGVVMSRLSD